MARRSTIPALVCRPGTEPDIETLVRFQQGLARETEDLALDAETLRAGLGALMKDPSLGHYWIAESQGRPIGSLMITFEWSDWRNRMIWWIQSVWVEPELRGQGVYAFLYDHIKSLATADDAVGGIRLYVDKRNQRAQDVYRRLGMNGDHYTTFEWMK
ncbi:MAG TPA: GNAT family N-acetyltransferase [Thermoanaerobaculia bacterium]|nr:GNAT family N-acetyltransferase [Thermoanaerobaculia bacterium]